MTQRFNAKWNRRNLPLWREVLLPLAGTPLSYLECGVYEGLTLCWMMRDILTHPKSYAVGIDAWDDSLMRQESNMEEIYQRALANVAEYGRRVKLHRGTFIHWLTCYLTPPPVLFDIIFIDGAHNPLDTLTDTSLCWRLANPDGGIVIWDCYKDETKQVIDEFLAHFQGQYEEAGENGRQLAIRRIGA